MRAGAPASAAERGPCPGAVGGGDGGGGGGDDDELGEAFWAAADYCGCARAGAGAARARDDAAPRRGPSPARPVPRR